MDIVGRHQPDIPSLTKDIAWKAIFSPLISISLSLSPAAYGDRRSVARSVIRQRSSSFLISSPFFSLLRTHPQPDLVETPSFSLSLFPPLATRTPECSVSPPLWMSSQIGGRRSPSAPAATRTRNPSPKLLSPSSLSLSSPHRSWWTLECAVCRSCGCPYGSEDVGLSPPLLPPKLKSLTKLLPSPFLSLSLPPATHGGHRNVLFATPMDVLMDRRTSVSLRPCCAP